MIFFKHRDFPFLFKQSTSLSALQRFCGAHHNFKTLRKAENLSDCRDNLQENTRAPGTLNTLHRVFSCNFHVNTAQNSPDMQEKFNLVQHVHAQNGNIFPQRVPLFIRIHYSSHSSLVRRRTTWKMWFFTSSSFFFSVILLFLFSTVTFCCLGAAGVKLLNFCCFPSELYSAGEKLVSRSPHQHIGSGCRQRLSCRRDSFQILWCVSQIVACLLVKRF